LVFLVLFYFVPLQLQNMSTKFQKKGCTQMFKSYIIFYRKWVKISFISISSFSILFYYSY